MNLSTGQRFVAHRGINRAFLSNTRHLTRQVESQEGEVVLRGWPLHAGGCKPLLNQDVTREFSSREFSASPVPVGVGHPFRYHRSPIDNRFRNYLETSWHLHRFRDINLRRRIAPPTPLLLLDLYPSTYSVSLRYRIPIVVRFFFGEIWLSAGIHQV